MNTPHHSSPPDGLEAFCMSDAEVAAMTQPIQQLRHLPGEKFLKGPVPWNWLVVAGRLKGSALQVGISLWHLSGLSRSRTVRFCLSRVEEMGVGAQRARRGLHALKRARLVSISYVSGAASEVTLLSVPKQGGATPAANQSGRKSNGTQPGTHKRGRAKK